MNERQKRFAAHVDTLRKRAATGDVIAKQELVRISQMAAQAARQVREQQVLGALTLAKQAAQSEAQLTEEDEHVGVVYAGTDRFDIADRIAGSAVEMDSLSRKVLQRNEEWQQLKDLAPFQRTNPVSVLNGILGNQIILDSGEQGDVANWEGEDAETCPVTVVLGPSNNTLTFSATGANTITPARPYAIVRFGTKGFSSTVEVDIGAGCQFTVNASAVRVTLVMPAALTGLNANRIPLTGMLSFNAPLRTTPITRTVYDDQTVVNLGHSATAVVPAFAKTLVVRTPNWADTWQLTLFDTAGSPVGTFTKAASSHEMENPILLSPDVAYCSVSANGGAGWSGGTRFVFELSL